MSHPLDFIIFGVPRSGTKGLVHAFNLHPNVYCAEELFHFRVDHSAITFPESFIEQSPSAGYDGRVKRDQIIAALSKKDNVRLAGNKLPRYYFALDRINREVPRLKNVWIYRSPYGFIPSWNRREQDRRGQWPRGQIGLFGLLELLVCIEACLGLPKDTFVFPYKYGLANSTDVIFTALDFIGADPSAYLGRTFEKKQRLQSRKRTRPRQEMLVPHPLSAYEEEILDALRINELDTLLEQDRGFLVSEVATDLREYLDSVTGVLPGALDRAFEACQNDAVQPFGHEYYNRYRHELSGLLKRTKGSAAVARFQDYSLYQRLKSLYVQRSALKRRLAWPGSSGAA